MAAFGDKSKKDQRRSFISKIIADEVNPFWISIAVFIILFVFEILFELKVGVSIGRFYLGDSNLGEKLELSEIPGRLPHYFVFSGVTAIFIFVILNEVQKAKKKKINES